ncbi:ABC transporter substrate-binding protein [Burkholderia sp. MR1-5-21]
MSEYLRILNSPSRRRILANGLGIVGASLIGGRFAWAADKITVADPGGVYTIGFGKAFYAPFRKTGAELVTVSRDAEPSSQMKAQVEAHSYIWDVVSLSLNSRRLLSTAGLLEPLNLSGPEWNQLIPQARQNDWMGTNVYGSILAYRTDTMKTRPSSWADFFDLKKHPGRRAMPRNPIQSLEGALLADGVDPKKLYPLDVDRAFRKLDTIKKDVAVWWTSFTQTTQLLQSGEVDILPTSNARAQAAIDNGAPVEIIWNGGQYGLEGWAIPRGNPRAEQAKKFISFCANGALQALYTDDLAYGPTNSSAYKSINAARAKQLPTYPSNFAKMIQLDDAWWGANKDAMYARFNAWLLKG